MGNGLELMLDIQQDEYLPVWGETGEGRTSLHSVAVRSGYLSHSQRVRGQVCVSSVCVRVLIPQSVKLLPSVWIH